MEAFKHNITIDVTWISTIYQEVDAASRITDVREAIVTTPGFKKIEKMLRWSFTLDCFATTHNKKCTRFISLVKESEALAGNFFTVQASKEKSPGFSHHKQYFIPLSNC